MPPHIAVVIPYFQRKPGILKKAVASALAQHGAFAVEIIIVDDASPVPAHSELAELVQAHPGAIRIIEQANAGPAAARNKALGAVTPGTTYVAFLDSDDEWIPSHLANAVEALEAGHDLYFADHFQLNQTVSAFQRAQRLKVGAHPAIGSGGNLHSYRGDMFDQIMCANVIGTSTVVYRYSAFPTLRFRPEFVNAGEDYLFWLDLSRLTARVAFSTLCECTYGEGVNIFAGSGWGTEKSLVRIHYEIKYRRALERLFPLNAEQMAFNRRLLATMRDSFVADVLHRLSHRKPLEPALLRAHWRVDPKSFLLFMPLAIRMKLRR